MFIYLLRMLLGEWFILASEKHNKYSTKARLVSRRGELSPYRIYTPKLMSLRPKTFWGVEI